MMEKNYRVKLNQIDFREALRYLGYGTGSPDETTKELLLSCEKQLLEAIDAKYLYKVFDLEQGQAVGTAFRLEGRSIQEHLKGCEKVIFMCATLSAGVDMLIRKKQILGMAEAMLIDSMASAAIEQVCNLAQEQILKTFPEYEHTWRFGLGYGDFPLAGQKQFLELLDAQKRIGVCVNQSFMMTPTKSVTCIIGLGHQLAHIDTGGCHHCSMREHCQFRKEGLSCGKQTVKR